ncbi:S1 family peptidase [Streptomyces sp. IBSBF 2435]|uniref:S1 family peptidase n=1 Tax=Streptomyces sp. IBSBF 2435 TaxID=2903531 RepID=UPI002FDC6CDE
MHATASGRRRLLTALTCLFTLAVVLIPSVTAQGAQRPRAARTFSATQLTAVGDAVRDAHVTGTAWTVDRKAGRVRVMVDESVDASGIAKLQQAAGDRSGALLVERTPGHLALRGPLPGDLTYDVNLIPCTIGYNVRIGGVYYWLTAGHCFHIQLPQLYVQKWPPGDPPPPDPLGQLINVSFPGNDFGLARYYSTPADTQGVVDLHNGAVQDITAAANPAVSTSACASGGATGVHCGQVTGLNYSVNLANGTVSGLIRANICSEAGDSGGPLYAGSTGLGLTSIGTGNCTTGGTTFYQPLVEALNAYGAQLY